MAASSSSSSPASCSAIPGNESRRTSATWSGVRVPSRSCNAAQIQPAGSSNSAAMPYTAPPMRTRPSSEPVGTVLRLHPQPARRFGHAVIPQSCVTIAGPWPGAASASSSRPRAWQWRDPAQACSAQAAVVSILVELADHDLHLLALHLTSVLLGRVGMASSVISPRGSVAVTGRRVGGLDPVELADHDLHLLVLRLAASGARWHGSAAWVTSSRALGVVWRSGGARSVAPAGHGGRLELVELADRDLDLLVLRLASGLLGGMGRVHRVTSLPCRLVSRTVRRGVQTVR